MVTLAEQSWLVFLRNGVVLLFEGLGQVLQLSCVNVWVLCLIDCFDQWVLSGDLR